MITTDALLPLLRYSGLSDHWAALRPLDSASATTRHRRMHKRLDLYEKGVLSTLYIVFSIKNQSEIDSDYLTVFFDTDRWHKGVSERAAEGARNHGLLNISADDFFDIDIFLPVHKEEQVVIGSYLRHLDNLITLHQRESTYFTGGFYAE